MRAVEERLTEQPTTLGDLAAEVYGSDVYIDREHIESVRRAAKRLAELGRAELGRKVFNTGWHDFIPGYPVNPREHLTVRRP